MNLQVMSLINDIILSCDGTFIAHSLELTPHPFFKTDSDG